MADKRISDLTLLSSADATDVVPLVDVSANTTKRTTVAGLAAAVGANIPSATVTPAMRTGGFQVGVIPGTTLSTTGNKTITGVGFTPKLVRFQLMPTNSTSQSDFGAGAMTATSQYGSAISYDGTSRSRTSSTTSVLLKIITGSGAAQLAFTYVSMNADGFTINVTAALSFDVAYEAYA
jgi:hypothetical protein